MDGIKELGKRRGLFENEIEFNDRYASIVRFLRDEVKIFNSFRDAYLNAAVIGFLKKSYSDISKQTNKVQPASIFPNELSARKQDLRFVFRMIMTVKEENDFSIDDYMNRTFRDGSEDDAYAGLSEKMEIFNSYVCIGLD